LRYYSTKNRSKYYSFREVVLKGLPEDNGLFMPEKFISLPAEFISSLKGKSISSIGYEISKAFVGEEIPADELKKICNEAFNFPVPLVELDDQTFIAELFRGPTLAFKDFGARFMARIMSYLNKGEKKKLTILVATSGDTGGAVADGFYDVEGIEVFILYPSGGVSDLQEKQLTTYGKNIRAIEVKGTFDDCQRLVKSAFLDDGLSKQYRLSSANSINIARLIPQMVYYFASYAQLPGRPRNVVFVVPSGNFGNLTAGLFANKIGLPVAQFIAATNVNDTVPLYLSGKGFNPRASTATISNAMDVGNPSNFGRMLDLFDNSLPSMQKRVTSFSFTDEETEIVMKFIYDFHSYILDPHGAVGIAGWNAYSSDNEDATGIILETAHPAKFVDTVERVLKISVPLPEALERLKLRTKSADMLSGDFEEFKKFMLANRTA
jgi:threonine synthase